MEELRKAARAIADADYLLITAGAGFSADSGLPVYADIARVEKYASRDKTYADLADISLLVTDPELFTEFWMSCVRTYNEKVPHPGYHILDKWCQNLLRKSGTNTPVNPFYVYTSNVDGYFRLLPVLNTHLCEMHGCVQEYICSSSIGFVHQAEIAGAENIPSSASSVGTHQLEYQPRQSAPWEEWNSRITPLQRQICRNKLFLSSDIFSSCNQEKQCAPVLCEDCHLPLRPKVVMFGDTCPNVLSRVMRDTDRYQAWENSLETYFRQEKAGKLVILELGCGTRVPSLRIEAEEVLRDVAEIICSFTNSDTHSNSSKMASSPMPVLIRVNLSAEESALSPEIRLLSPGSCSVQGNCLDSLRAIDKIMTSFSPN